MRIDVDMSCVFCGDDHAVEVELKDYERWENGELAQNAFPYLTPTEREQLISGICPKCQAKIFGQSKKTLDIFIKCGIIVIEREVNKMIKVYECKNGESEKDLVCELWGASTKHPDSRFYFSEWKYKNDFLDDEVQVFQWLLWIASNLTWPFHAKELAEYALENWYKW